ncbi:unnamed protein product [Soboliphyme baturini]|uniref:Uncharacterized protein n=1 Tax=Soboliphyme baturini TaxID=241478 RepID=A0A183ISM8_9BILA|nr:unnamed protein product [Soboliphyme baturini]
MCLRVGFCVVRADFVFDCHRQAYRLLLYLNVIDCLLVFRPDQIEPPQPLLSKFKSCSSTSSRRHGYPKSTGGCFALQDQCNSESAVNSKSQAPAQDRKPPFETTASQKQLSSMAAQGMTPFAAVNEAAKVRTAKEDLPSCSSSAVRENASTSPNQQEPPADCQPAQLSGSHTGDVRYDISKMRIDARIKESGNVLRPQQNDCHALHNGIPEVSTVSRNASPAGNIIELRKCLVRAFGFFTSKFIEEL